MLTSEYDGVPLSERRSHPWRDARANSAFRYYDFISRPALIRTSLEDFLPWVQYPAIERFFTLLEWLNGGASPFESNDCEFTGPGANEHASIAKLQQCSGRVMVLFRTLGRNTVAGEIEQLSASLHRELAELDPDFRYGMIGTTRVPVRYLALQGAKQPYLGAELMVSFWTWGNDESETFLNLERLVHNLHVGLSRVAAEFETPFANV
jgi:hypothetical protein